jgi:hypothetical protein
MASHEVKIVRRALALDELNRLSQLLADNLGFEMPDVRITHRDPQLKEIQRIEAINELLKRVLETSGVETEPEPEAGDDLEHMKKAELFELAESKGVEVNKSSTKADIIEAIETHGS